MDRLATSASAAILSKGENLRRLADDIIEARPQHRSFLDETLRSLTEAEVAEAEQYLRHLLRSQDLPALQASYLTILDDTFAAQLNFTRTGSYEFTKFSDVAQRVYFDQSYMQRYMVGLALTMFFWANHVQIRRFFSATFPKRSGGRYLEVGPGHGFFLLTAMRLGRSDSYKAVDISAASIALTDAIIRDVLPESYPLLELAELDFLTDHGLEGPFDTLVMGEVLEHVEQPLEFVRRLRALAAPAAHVFVTTCINTPAIDHIYLFRNEKEVAELVTAGGFEIKDSLQVPRPGYSLEKCVRSDLPINLAYVLTPR